MDDRSAVDMIGCAQIAFLAAPLLREAGAQRQDYAGDELLVTTTPLAHVPPARLGTLLRASEECASDDRVARLTDQISFTGKPRSAEAVRRAVEELTDLSRTPGKTRLRECMAAYRMERFSRTIQNTDFGAPSSSA